MATTTSTVAPSKPECPWQTESHYDKPRTHKVENPSKNPLIILLYNNLVTLVSVLPSLHRGHIVPE